MKQRSTLLATLIAILFCAASPALAQPGPGGATRSVSYRISAVADSGVGGTVYIGEFGENLTAVVIAVRGTPAGGAHPAHLHAGDCDSDGGIVVPLSDVDGDSGLGVTLISTPYDDVVGGDLYLNIHASSAELGTVVACGDVGAGVAETAAGTAETPTPADAAATPVQAEEFGTPSTVSYGVFPVEGSGVRGNLQVSEMVGGGTRWTLTLFDIEPGKIYAATLYRGDCGPDRPELFDLVSVGLNPDDPFTSVSELAVPYGEVIDGDAFLYLFAGEKTGPLVACGEVGVGANR